MPRFSGNLLKRGNIDLLAFEAPQYHLFLGIHHPLWQGMLVPNHTLKRNYCASLIVTMNASFIQSNQDIVDADSFSALLNLPF